MILSVCWLVSGPHEVIAAVRAHYGLDLPAYQQYFVYMSNVLQGDLGNSIPYQRPVTELILNFLPSTIFLIVYVICITVPTTVFLAILSAKNEGGLIDQIINQFTVLGLTIPVFWPGIMMARLFGVDLGWLPVMAKILLVIYIICSYPRSGL